MENFFQNIYKILPVERILNHWENVDKQFPNYKCADNIESVSYFFDNDKKLNIMEIGTRRSNPDIATHHKHLFKNIDKYVMVDSEYGLDVDVVCDVHTLSRKFSETFDVIIICSGYEHFKYPQLASHEILKCLNINGIVYIQTHQTFPLHGYPNDYCRFSLDALDALFPKTMGTEIMAKSYKYPVSIIPINKDGDTNLLKNWNILGKSFLNSCIIVKKINKTPEIFIYDI